MSMSRADIDRIALWCRHVSLDGAGGRVRLEPLVTGRHIDLIAVDAPVERGGRGSRTPVARLRFMSQTGLWTLYWRDGEGAFNVYRNFPAVRSVNEILDFLSDDPDPLFWAQP